MGVVGRKPIQTQERLQRPISAQQTGVRRAFGAYQDRRQKRHKGTGGFDLIRGRPADRHVLANPLHQADLVEEGKENRKTSEGRHRALRLAQD